MSHIGYVIEMFFVMSSPETGCWGLAVMRSLITDLYLNIRTPHPIHRHVRTRTFVHRFLRMRTQTLRTPNVCVRTSLVAGLSPRSPLDQCRNNRISWIVYSANSVIYSIINPLDILLSGLRFYRDSSSSIFFLFARYSRSSLNSTKTDLYLRNKTWSRPT